MRVADSHKMHTGIPSERVSMDPSCAQGTYSSSFHTGPTQDTPQAAHRPNQRPDAQQRPPCYLGSSARWALRLSSGRAERDRRTLCDRCEARLERRAEGRFASSPALSVELVIHPTVLYVDTGAVGG